MAVALVATSVVWLAGCASHGRAAESESLVPQEPGDLQGSEWLLIATGETDAVPPSSPLTLLVGDGTASGSGPCNRYQLPFVIDGYDLDTGSVAATRIACAPDVMAAEDEYFRGLERADTIEIVAGQLQLTGPDDLRMLFARADDAAGEIAGEWDVVNIATGDALESVGPGTAPRLDFQSHGTVGIDGGCNSGSADWDATGRSLTIEAPRMTLKLCDSPPGTMDQETNLVAALSRVATIESALDRVVLLDDDGAIVLVLSRVES